MLGITYKTWKDTCQMYFDLGKGAKAAYLQWFPFTKISSNDQDTLASETFYNQYIKSGAFVLFPTAMHRSENFIQKGDGSFRDSSLLSPVLYLVLQAMGKEVSTVYSPQRGNQIEVFYAGNYDEMRPKYKQDYDDFFKAINTHINESQYFIKTDLSNFFSNINVDLLVSRIDSICNKDAVCFSQTQLSILKELLLYCGGGRFPLVENSVASSFLATVVYLDEIDSRLASFIDAHILVFDSYKIIRYVDDMYILISSDRTESEIHDAYNRIRNKYEASGIMVEAKSVYSDVVGQAFYFRPDNCRGHFGYFRPDTCRGHFGHISMCPKARGIQGFGGGRPPRRLTGILSASDAASVRS